MLISLTTIHSPPGNFRNEPHRARPVGVVGAGTRSLVMPALNVTISLLAGKESRSCLVRVHMLRHSTGYALAGRGMDTRRLQHYLGHASITNTVRYTGRPSRSKTSSFRRVASFAAARRCQRFLSPTCDASSNRACNDIAHFSRWPDQQAKLAENQMSFF
jgi:hypothetical protein